VIGDVKAIRDGTLSIEGAGTVLEVPVARVKQVELASLASNVKVKPQTVRGYFSTGPGSLTFNLDRWTPEEISASSENFGAAAIKPEAFSRIVFDVSSDPVSGAVRGQ
jgi:hypothetical protein